MEFTYFIILAVVFIVSPFVLRLASKQDKVIKRQLKISLLLILFAQTVLGFLNWENFTSGRSGFELSIAYPNSFLALFFVINILQFTFLLINKTFNTLIVVLNFINTVLIFVGMIRLSTILDFQVVSFASVGEIFLVLLGNIVGLTFINKDKSLLKKYFR